MTAVTFKEDMEWNGQHRAQGEAVNMEVEEAKDLAKQGKVNIWQPMTELSESQPVEPHKIADAQGTAVTDLEDKVNEDRNAAQTTEEPQAPGEDTTQEQQEKSVESAPVNKQVKGAPNKK